MNKVVLINSPSHAGSPRVPLGLMYIASALEKEGYPTDIIDIKSNKGIDEVINQIIARLKEIKPIAVGMGALLSEEKELLKLSLLIKRELPNCKIIVGNVQASFYPQYFIFKGSPIDFIALGEGELTFPKLLNCIKTKGNVDEVPGLAYLKKEKIIKTKEEFIKDLDEIPFPAYDKVDMKYYTKPNLYAIRGVPVASFYVFSSRGCNYRCNFCVNKNVFKRTVRFRDPKKVVDEMEYLVKNYNLDAIYFYDDTFTLKKSRVIEICDEIIKRNLKIIWGCETRVDLIWEEMVEKMAKAGCIQIDFGFESGSQKQLNAVLKDTTIEKTIRGYNICKKYGIRTFTNLMINTPGETEDDIQQTIKVVREINSNVYSINVCSPYPGSELYLQFQDKVKPDEFDKIKLRDDFNGFLEFTEKNFRLVNHNIPLKDVIKIFHNEFPVALNYKLKFNRHYIKQIFLSLSFLINKHYMRSMLSSKRKSDYFQFYYNFVKNAISSKASGVTY